MTTPKKTPKKTATKSGVKMHVSQGHVAKLAIQNIQSLYKKLGLDPQTTKGNKRLLVGTSHVPILLIEEVAAASDQHGTLIGMSFDSDAARQAVAYSMAFEPVATHAEALAQSVRDAILLAKSDVGNAALAAYASLKGIVRTKEGAPLRGSLDKMTQIMRHRRKGKGGKKAQPPVDAAAPTPPAEAPAATKDAATPATPPVKAADKNATTIVVNTPGGSA